MKRYNCVIRKFLDTTPRIGDGIIKYRMRIETILEDKIDQPDEKQYWKNYEINVTYTEILRNSLDLSDIDFEKVLCEYARNHFIKEFTEGVCSSQLC